jgi:hypothetical protein
MTRLSPGALAARHCEDRGRGPAAAARARICARATARPGCRRWRDGCGWCRSSRVWPSTCTICGETPTTSAAGSSRPSATEEPTHSSTVSGTTSRMRLRSEAGALGVALVRSASRCRAVVALDPQVELAEKRAIQPYRWVRIDARLIRPDSDQVGTPPRTTSARGGAVCPPVTGRASSPEAHPKRGRARWLVSVRGISRRVIGALGGEAYEPARPAVQRNRRRDCSDDQHDRQRADRRADASSRRCRVRVSVRRRVAPARRQPCRARTGVGRRVRGRGSGATRVRSVSGASAYPHTLRLQGTTSVVLCRDAG